MGLDMYLTAETYINKRDYRGDESLWKDGKPPVEVAYKDIIRASGLRDFADSDVVSGVTVQVQAAYWRKANQIHGWFVRENDGVDDCRPIYVSRTDLERLLAVCKAIMENRDDKQFVLDVLPPSQGFFFGSDEIDEFYFQDIEYTIDRLEKLLSAPNPPNGVTYEYRASW